MPLCGLGEYARPLFIFLRVLHLPKWINYGQWHFLLFVFSLSSLLTLVYELSYGLFIIMTVVLATMICITDSRVSVHFMLHLVGNRLVGRFVLLKTPAGFLCNISWEMPCWKMVIEFSFTNFHWQGDKLKANIHTYFECWKHSL